MHTDKLRNEIKDFIKEYLSKKKDIYIKLNFNKKIFILYLVNDFLENNVEKFFLINTLKISLNLNFIIV